MSEAAVLNIKNALKAKQLLERFDVNALRLQNKNFTDHQEATDILNMLSEALEEAIENGTHPAELQSRANQLAQLAFDEGFEQHEVEELLTMRPNPNGKRPT